MAYKRKRKRSLINADTFGLAFSASVVVALLAIAFTDFGSQIKVLIGQKPGCDIKGNIGPTGERIYHVPGDPWYAKTQISRHKGKSGFAASRMRGQQVGGDQGASVTFGLRKPLPAFRGSSPS